MSTRMDQDMLRWRERAAAVQTNLKRTFDPGIRKDAQQTRDQQVNIMEDFIRQGIHKAPDVFVGWPDPRRIAEYVVSWIEGGGR